MAFLSGTTQVFAPNAQTSAFHACPAVRRGLRTKACAELTLADPPYALDALEPHISKDTMDLHWGKHHRTYVTNLNNQLKGKPLLEKPIVEIVKETWNSGKPTAEFNNAGQIFNHDFYWESMKNPGGGGEPTGELKSAVEAAFGSVADFKKQFKAAGATQFGSGWAWLVVKSDGSLAIEKTPNAETPLTTPGVTPILTMDVWEHAYYVDTQNRRPEYIETFVEKLINWEKVAERYTAAK